MKQVSQLDADGYFVGMVTADESPMEPGVYLIPGGCIDTPAPVIPDGQLAKWDGEWVFEDIPQPEPEPEPIPDPKFIGILFEGVMCSATSNDAAGLLQIEAAIRLTGDSLSPMHFSNGTVHFIGKDNYQAFMSVWVPFRSSFFKDPK